MKIFALYTFARAGLFLACYGVIWLTFGQWIEWNALSGLWTALIAMLLSSGIALVALRSMRADLSAAVAERADRAKAAFDARNRAEDDE